jgi:hypothetical protein
MLFYGIGWILAALAGCYDPVFGSKGEVIEDPTYEADIGPLFEASCMTCHSADTAFGGFDLSGGLDSMIDQPSTVADLNYVTPEDPETSYLYLKMADRQLEVGGSGGVMPQGGAFSADTLTTVENWILDGAP